MGHDTVDQATLQGGRGVEHRTGQDHLEGFAHADPAGEQHGQSAAGHDADAQVGVGERGPLRGHAVRRS